MDISKVISDAVDNVSYQTSNGMIDLEDPNHLFLVREELKKHLDYDLIDLVIEGLSKSSYINLSYAALAMGKTTQLNGFLAGLTNEAGKLIAPKLKELETEQKKLEKKNKGLKPNNTKYEVGKQCQEFFKILHSVNKVEDLKTYPSSGLEGNIFELGGGTGMPGKGEVWASVMVPKTVVSGTGKSYDLTSPGGNYEVKDNRTGGSVRLGVHAALSKFEWWDEVIETASIVKEILGNKQLIDVLQPLYGATALNLIMAMQTIQGRYSATVGSGAFANKDITAHDKFYKIAGEFGQSPIDGYTEVQFHGPNRQPAIRAITPLGKDKIPKKGTVPIDLLDKQPEEEIAGLRTKLNSLKYVREPEAFEVDRDKSVQEVADAYGKYKAIFMIFRKGKIHYVNPKDFMYKESSQGKIKVTYAGY
jgi:hypothetical protein